jgi:hypothetical protein
MATAEAVELIRLLEDQHTYAEHAIQHMQLTRQVYDEQAGMARPRAAGVQDPDH